MDSTYKKLRTPPPPPGGDVSSSKQQQQQHEIARQETFNSDNSRASFLSQSSAGTETAQEVDLTRDFDVELQPMPSRRPALVSGGGSGASSSASHRRLTAVNTAAVVSAGTAASVPYTQYKHNSISHTYDPTGEYHESYGRATAASYVEDTLRGLHKSSAAVQPDLLTTTMQRGERQTQTQSHAAGGVVPSAKLLPRKYLSKPFKLNSYFALRLLRIAEVIVALDVVGLAFFYGFRRSRSFDDGALFVAAPIAQVFASDQSCRPTVALAALVYHLFPASLVLALPASGLRVLEPFKREQRIDAAGRLQKVKRTFFLQFCELAGVTVLLYAGAIAAVLAFFVTSGKLFQGCAGHGAAYVFALGAVVVYVVTLLQVRAFARFREHLKMQLGAFKESDQTGDIKAHMLRSKLRRREQQHLRQHLKAGATGDGAGGATGTTGTAGAAPPPPPPKRSVLIADIKKRLFRGAQLGDLRLLRRSLRVARVTLGGAFATELFPDATIALWVFGFAQKNPLHVAAYQGNIAAMELLVRARFNVNAFDKVSRVRFSTGDLFWYVASYFICKPVESAEEAHSSIFKTTLVTPLHCAVSTGRIDAVRWLLAHGADANLCSKSTYRSESRLPPIFLADHPDIVRELLIAGANHLAIPDPGHMNTITVLQLAYLRQNYAVAQVLEDWGGDVALTPLHTAAAMNDTARMRYFLRKRVDPDCLGELAYIGLNKRTPLHWAAVNGAVEAVELLLESRANANAQDARGRTPLHWAARVNRLAIVRVLLAHGADPNIVDDSDMTPILCAACAGGTTEDMFKAMTAHGGDINHQLRATGDTALHIAVKLDDQQTALAILSLGGDILRTNNDGFRAIDCTSSTRLQFELKRAAGTRDVMISYTHSHMAFALKLRKSLEDANVTTWLDLMDPSGIGGGAVWREEIARGITNAAVVLCVITEDYAASEWCLKELALAKQVGTPIVAISTERATISEELQVYLYTRQIIPFEPAITAVETVSEKEIVYAYDDDAYRAQVRILLDGLRDEIEKRKEVAMRRILRRDGTGVGGSGSGGLGNSGVHNVSSVHGSAGASARALLKTRSGASSNGTNLFNSMQFNERALAATGVDATNNSVFDSARSLTGAPGLYSTFDVAGGGGNRSGYDLAALRSHRSFVAGGSRRHIGGSGRDIGGLSRASSASSMSEDFTDSGLSTLQSNSLVLDTGGYYFHRPDASSVVAAQGDSDVRGSLLETFEALESATASGEQFVFICHGDHHGRFVRKLCVDLCRDGGFRCYLDQRHRLQQLPSKIDEGSDESVDALSSTTVTAAAAASASGGDSMSRRILEAKEAILKCSAFVVVLSAKTLANQLVKDQLAFAEDKGKRILPVVMNDLDFALDMKYSLARSEFFHFFSKGDMMGFDSTLARLLDSLREEVFGISVDTLRLGTGGGGAGSTHALVLNHSEHLSSYAGSSRGGDLDDRFAGGVHDSFVSVSSTHSGLGSYMGGGGGNGFGYPGNVRRRRLSTHSTGMGSDGGGGDMLPPFGLPSSHRQSQSFIGSSSFLLSSSAAAAVASGSSSSRGLTSDMSLSQAMIGNFSSLMGRISDDLDEEDYDDLSYAGVEGGGGADSDDNDDLDDFDIDIDDRDAKASGTSGSSRVPVNDNVALNHFVDIMHTAEAAEPTPRRHSASSISILERKSDDVTMSIDAMDTSTL